MSFSRTMLFLFDFCVAIAWPLYYNCLAVALQFSFPFLLKKLTGY